MKRTKVIVGSKTDEYSGSPLLGKSNGGDVAILKEGQEGKFDGDAAGGRKDVIVSDDNKG